MITEKQFKAACDRHKPNWFVRVVYRYFNTDLKRKPRPLGSWFLILVWIVSVIGMITFDQLGNKNIAGVFACMLMVFFIFIITLPAYIMNQLRINKICKELGIDKETYNNLVTLYYK